MWQQKVRKNYQKVLNINDGLKVKLPHSNTASYSKTDSEIGKDKKLFQNLKLKVVHAIIQT